MKANYIYASNCDSFYFNSISYLTFFYKTSSFAIFSMFFFVIVEKLILECNIKRFIYTFWIFNHKFYINCYLLCEFGKNIIGLITLSFSGNKLLLTYKFGMELAKCPSIKIY